MAAEPDVQPAEADTGGLMGIIRGSIPQIILIYALSTALVAFRGGANGRGSSSATHAGGAGVSPLPVVNGFLGEVLELRVYMTEREAFAEFEDAAALVWTQPFTLGGPAGMLSGELAAINLSYVPSAALLRNESAVWAHLFLTRAGFSPDPRSAMYAAFATVDRHHSLVQYRQTGGNKKLKSLLGGSGGGGARAAVAVDGDDDEEAEAPRRSPFWKPLLSIAICSDGTPFPTPAAMPEPLAEHLALRTAPLARLGALSGGARVGGGAGAGGESGVLDAGAAAERTVYLPRPFVNELWLSANQLVAINASLAHGANQKAEIRRAPAASAAELVAAGALPLVLELHTVSLLKISLYAQLGKTLSAQADKGADGISGAASAEEFRRLVTETNPYLLLVTVVVTVLHSLFDFLAFRNEVKFWKAAKSMEGLSTRALLVGLFVQAVTFLYLLDSDRETSRVILFSNGIALLIELWKVQRVCAASIEWEPPALTTTTTATEAAATTALAGWRARLPRVKFGARDAFAHTATATYDKQAAEYVAWALLPLVLGTSLYSLAFSQYKSWYSWALRSLVSAVYAFGFANQAPQLFINYKLKSTAHMPWKTLCYKALNTFIDDLFAFVIKMPTMHRLSCLRDDVIFFIFLYQRYAYGVDDSRANEYGQRATTTTTTTSAAAALQASDGQLASAGGAGATAAVAAAQRAPAAGPSESESGPSSADAAGLRRRQHE